MRHKISKDFILHGSLAYCLAINRYCYLDKQIGTLLCGLSRISFDTTFLYLVLPLQKLTLYHTYCYTVQFEIQYVFKTSMFLETY